MNIDKIFVVVLGIISILFTYWFFLLKKEKTVKAENRITIIVDGGYNPETISISQNKTTTLTFLRKDPNPCLEEVILSDFKIKKSLPLNQNVEIEITPTKSGVFPFSCNMGMFHGKLIVN